MLFSYIVYVTFSFSLLDHPPQLHLTSRAREAQPTRNPPESTQRDIIDTLAARAPEVNDVDIISFCVLVVVGALGFQF